MAALLNLNAGEYLTFPVFTPTDAANWSFSIDFETPTDILSDQTIVGHTEVSANRVVKLYIRDGFIGVLHSTKWAVDGFIQFKARPNTRYKLRATFSGNQIRLYAFGEIVAQEGGRNLSLKQGMQHISTLMSSASQGSRLVRGDTKIYSFEIFDDADSTILVRSYDIAASIEHNEIIETVSNQNATPQSFTLSEGKFTEFYDWGDLQTQNYGLALPKYHYAEFEKPTIGAWAFRIKVYIPELGGQVRLISSKGESGDTRFYARMSGTGAINAHIESPTGYKTITTSLKMKVGYNEVIFFVDFRNGGYMRVGINDEFEGAVVTNANFEGIYNNLGDNFAINGAMFTGGFTGGDNIIAKFIELAIFRWDGASRFLGACWDVFDFNQPNYYENTLLSVIGKRLITSNWNLTGRRSGGPVEEGGRIVGYQMSRDHYVDTEITESMTDYEIDWVGVPEYFDSGDNGSEGIWQALWHKQEDGQIYLSRANEFRFYVKSQGVWRNITLALPPAGVRLNIKTIVTPTKSEIYFDGVLVGSVSYPKRTAVRSDRLRINRRSDNTREDQGGIWMGESLKITCHNNPSLSRDFDFSKMTESHLPDSLNGQHATLHKDSHYGFVKVSEREIFTDVDYPKLSDFVTAQLTNPNPMVYKNGKGLESLKDFKAFIDWVNLPEEFHTAVTTGQEFIIATDPLGVNRLPVDLRHYDPVQSLFKAWTRMHEYGNGKIWILYGKEGFTQPAFEEPFGELAVWDDEESVFHLSQSPSNETHYYHNSAGNRKGSGRNFISSDKNILSPVGYGTKFGNDRYFIAGLTTFVDNFMFTAWVNTYSASVDGRIMSVMEWDKRYNDGKDIALWTDKDNGGLGYAAAVRYTGSAGDDLRSGEYHSNVVLDEWQHVAVHIFVGGIALWVNGVEQFRKLTTKTFDFATWNNLQLAKLWTSDSNAHYPGSIATARVSKHARVESLSFEYANQSDPASFWQTGTPEDATGTDFARRVQLTGMTQKTQLPTIGQERDTLIIEDLDASAETLELIEGQSKIFRRAKIGGIDATSAEGEILIDESEVGDVKG